MKHIAGAEKLIGAILTLTLAGPAFAGTPEAAGVSGSRHRWLPVQEMQRLFRAAPREVVLFAPVFAPAFSRDFQEGLESRLAGHGYALTVMTPRNGAPPAQALADAVSGSPRPLATVILLLDGAAGPEGWRLPLSALLKHDPYGPTTLLALRGSEQRSPVLQAARASDMAVVDVTGIEDPEETARVLSECALSLSGPHPGLYGFLLFPVAAAAVWGLRLRSRDEFSGRVEP